MLLKSIEFNDFRPFIGQQKINFECSEDTNVIVILGENTHGKSTLILSFLWCFYGQSKFDKPSDILNKKIEKEMILNEHRKASVKIELEHDSIDYIIKREQNFTKKNNVLAPSQQKFIISYVDENGETKNVKPTELEQTINSIIPKDLMSYFFFEGEKDNHLSKKQIGGAVKNLLGLDVLSKAMMHLHGDSVKVSMDSVMGKFYSAQNDSANVLANAEYNKMIETGKKLDTLEYRLKEIGTQIEKYEEKIDEINKILLENAPTRDLQKEREKIVSDKKLEEEAKERAISTYIKYFNDNALSLLLLPLFEKTRKRLDEMELDDKSGIAGIDGTAIKELLNRKECLCGTDLYEGSLAYKKVEKYISILPPVSIGILIREMFDTMSQTTENAHQFTESFKNNFKNIQYSINRFNSLEREEASISAKLQNVEKINDKQFELDLQQYKMRLQDLRKEEKECLQNQVTYSSALNTATNNYNTHKSKSDKNAKFQLYYQYAEIVYRLIKSMYTAKEENLRKRLNDIVSDLFTNIYSGSRTVEIDSSYRIKVTDNGDELSLTGGLELVLYFSYIGGLAKLALEELKQRNDEADIYGEEYPLVLDAAFSHADTEHIYSISKHLSTTTSQLIFAIMERDWDHAKGAIENRVHRTYYLKKISEKEVHIMEA